MPDVVIIGGGIAGLATAYRLQQDAPGADRPLGVRVVESAPRFGGKIVTDREEGFLIEGGPDSIIPQKPWALELIRELGIGDRLLGSNDARRGTYVLHAGRLAALPDGLQMLAPESWRGFLRSPLLSWPGKLRFALEGLVPKRRGEGDESVAGFVRRRLGEEALWGLAEPMLAHIHVADVERMSLRATYPRFAELEARHGSLRRGAAMLRAKQRAAGGSEKPAGPIFWSLRGGLGELVDALVKALDPASRLAGRTAVGLRRADGDAGDGAGDGGGYIVRLDDGRELAADAVVLATPADAAAELVAGLDAELARKLRAIRYVSMATVSFGYRRADVAHPLDGFGFFVPRREGRRVLACTWTSTKFDHRAPEDAALLRVFLGGAGHEELLDAGDDALLRAVSEDLRAIMGLDAEPILARLYRWPRGYPQYDVGHLERLRELETRLPPGLALAGSAYHGVGLPDCVRSGAAAAGRIREVLRLG